VVVHGRDKARSEETAHEIRELGVRSAVTIGDLTIDADATQVCDAALAAFEKIDILVNNCSVALRQDSPDWIAIRPNEWADSFEKKYTRSRFPVWACRAISAQLLRSSPAPWRGISTAHCCGSMAARPTTSDNGGRQNRGTVC
jgi:NAD(P)-dependent dehydrogenase (short-subunit alcohol dehydrogenase family)